MSAYSALARYYDALTYDVDYAAFADFYEDVFKAAGLGVKTILDIACGTGSVMKILADRGYDMVGADVSEDMLALAAERLLEAGYSPRLLCQGMDRLDLYGTVDAAVSTLDGINYVRPSALEDVFSRVRLFLEPGGVFIFDILSPERLRALDGTVSCDETDEVLCVWRTARGRAPAYTYSVDLFERQGSVWRRFSEEHTVYAHTREAIMGALEAAGFADISQYGGGAGKRAFDGRVFFSARKGENGYG